MSQLCWIIDQTDASFLDRSTGLARQFLLPAVLVHSDPALIVGATVWIVIRGRDYDGLFAHVVVEEVQEFLDGLNTGDYLIFVSLVKSCRIIADSKRVIPIRDKILSSKPVGLCQIDEMADQLLSKEASRLVRSAFKRPTGADLSRLPSLTGTKLSDEAIAEKLLAGVSSNYSLETTWGTIGNRPLPPFANFAFERAVGLGLADVNSSLRDILAELDPTLAILQRAVDEGGSSRPRMSQAQRNTTCGNVDINFAPIDPTLIYARRYVARTESDFNNLDSVLKTEQAEAKHQEILRDVAGYVYDRGIVPNQSRSVDLALEVGGRLLICEIKSTSEANLLSQVSKGCFQLLAYRMAVRAASTIPVELVLIVEATRDTSSLEMLRAIAGDFGVRLVVYDESRPWPLRIDALDECLGI
jgi:hypothetical protein